MKKLRVATLGTPADYSQSLIPIIIRDLGYDILWTSQSDAELIIYGPFYKKEKEYRYIPKPLRLIAGKLATHITSKKRLKSFEQVSLFQTAENKRYDFIETDYSLSFDLTDNSNHFRFPYWMELVDWSKEGIIGNVNSRFGRLLSISKMMQPLGKHFLERPMKAALITSHLGEPRKTLYTALSKIIPVDGYGPHFNEHIKDHHRSGFEKFKILQNYAFNLCPENSSYPGYYTEKIPEAFLSGCLPLAYANPNIAIDFNPSAMINLEPMAWNFFERLGELLHSKSQLLCFAEQPLLLREPSIEPLKIFINKIVKQASS